MLNRKEEAARIDDRILTLAQTGLAPKIIAARVGRSYDNVSKKIRKFRKEGLIDVR